MHVLLQSIELLPVNLLQVVFTFFGAFAALLIWHLKRFRSLAVYFIFQAVLMLFNLLEELQVTRSYYLLTPVFTLATGPLLYFFIRAVVNDKDLPPFIIGLHFVPMLLALPFTSDVQRVIGFGSLSQIVYLTAAFHLLYRYHVASMAVRSDANSLTLNWIVKALSVYALIIINDVVRLNLQQQTPPQLKAFWYFVAVAVIFAISCYLLFKVLRQPQLFDGMRAYEASLAQVPQADEQVLADSVFASLEQTIINDALYKKPRLSVLDLSEVTGLNVKDISWAINQACQQNFCEYINGLRVKAVQQQISTVAVGNTSLLDMAFAAGFNSKSTFNAAFKKGVGMTPSQFVRQNTADQGAKS
ncbi:MAG: helix-turn-helix transcriptional regulator [Algicola sp.]|nr:helix-turn-helix transcriptional regulator [Algicola sp.]